MATEHSTPTHSISPEAVELVVTLVEEQMERAEALAILLMNGLADQCKADGGSITLWRTAQVLAEDVLGTTGVLNGVRCALGVAAATDIPATEGVRAQMLPERSVAILLAALNEIEGQLNEVRLMLSEDMEGHEMCVVIDSLQHCGAKAAAAAEYVGGKAFHGSQFWTLPVGFAEAAAHG